MRRDPTQSRAFSSSFQKLHSFSLAGLQTDGQDFSIDEKLRFSRRSGVQPLAHSGRSVEDRGAAWRRGTKIRGLARAAAGDHLPSIKD